MRLCRLWRNCLGVYGVYDAGRVLGVTTLDVVRAETFLAEAETEAEGEGRGSVGVLGGRRRRRRRRRRVDVVGGHSPQTNGTAIKPGGAACAGGRAGIRRGCESGAGWREGGILR